MADLIFQIKTPAELSGAQQAAQALGESIGKAKSLGKEYANLEVRLQAVTASIAAFKAAQDSAAGTATTTKAADDSARYAQSLEQMAAASHEARAEEAQRLIDLKATGAATGRVGFETEETATKTKLFAGHAKELKKTIQELSREFPIAGLALKALANPIAATLTIAIGFFVAMKRGIDETNRALDEMAARSAKPLSDFAANFRAAQNEAIASNEAFIKGITAIATAAGDVSKNADAAIGAIHRLTAAQIELNDAAQAKALAQTNLDEQTGKITPGQGIARRQQIKDFYAAEAAKAQTAGEDAEIARRERELTELQQRRSTVAGIAGAGGSETIRKARIATLKQQAANAGVDAADFASQIGPATDKRDSRVDELNNIKRIIPNDPGDVLAKERALATAQQRLDEAQAELDLLQRRQAAAVKLQQQSEARAAAIEGQAKAQAAAQSEAEKLGVTIDGLTRQLKELRDTIELNRGVRSQTGELNRDTRTIDSEIEKNKADAEAQRKFNSNHSPAIPFSGGENLSNAFLAYHSANQQALANLQQTIEDATSQLNAQT